MSLLVCRARGCGRGTLHFKSLLPEPAGRRGNMQRLCQGGDKTTEPWGPCVLRPTVSWRSLWTGEGSGSPADGPLFSTPPALPDELQVHPACPSPELPRPAPTAHPSGLPGTCVAMPAAPPAEAPPPPTTSWPCPPGQVASSSPVTHSRRLHPRASSRPPSGQPA